jgi:hypothetical protein
VQKRKAHLREVARLAVTEGLFYARQGSLDMSLARLDMHLAVLDMLLRNSICSLTRA